VTTEEFAAGWVMLLEVYGDQLKDKSDEERKEQRTLYYRMLREMDGALWQEVCGVAIQSSKWFPRISELVAYASELSRLRSGDPGMHGGDGAFQLALRAVRRLDPFTRKPMCDVRDDVDACVRALGGWGRLALVEEGELGWYRKEFIAAWEGANGLRERLGPVATGRLVPGADGTPPYLASGRDRALVEGQLDRVGPTRGEGVLDAVARSLEGTGPGADTAWEGES
jgi:hypothetical protein